jgi:hypothetical protein
MDAGKLWKGIENGFVAAAKSVSVPSIDSHTVAQLQPHLLNLAAEEPHAGIA